MYFFIIVQALVDHGYTRDDDIRGAPYDWRKAPSEKNTNMHTTQTSPHSVGLKAFGSLTNATHMFSLC